MKRLTWFLPFLLALPVMAQPYPRGGPTNRMAVYINNCVTTSGACPADGYVCASGKIIYQCMVSSGWRKLSIGGASNTPTAGQCATWDAVNSTVLWADCGTGGGGGGTSTIKESTSTVSSAATTLDFGAGFDLVESPSGYVTIALDPTEAPIDLSTAQVTNTLPIAKGGTGQVTAATARSALGAAASGANSDITSITGLSTMLAPAQGGTGLNTSATADDSVLVSTGAGTWSAKAIGDCQTGHQLLYTAATNTFSCEVDGSAGTGSYKIVQEEGAALGVSGSGDTINFVGPALTAAGAGATKTVTLAQTGSGTKVVDQDYTITSGAGLGGGQAMTGSGLTLTTASQEVAFLADGGASALTCGAAAGGKMQVMDSGILQYCDGAATSVLQYAALADSAGKATTGDSATAFFTAGTLEVARGGTGATAIGSDTYVLFNDGGAVSGDAGMTYNKTTDALTVGSVTTAGATDGNRYLELQTNTPAEPSAPAVDYVRIYAMGNGAAAIPKFQTSAGIVAIPTELTACIVKASLANADDNYEFWMAPSRVTVTGAACYCRGTCTTVASLSMHDRNANALTISWPTPTCAKGTTDATYAAVTANSNAVLVSGEGLQFDVAPTPNPETDTYTICIKYKVTP